MNNKAKKGFTLVELIVVIAIIGILAAILVPAMIGYISDAKFQAANASAKTVFGAINNYAEKCMVAGNKIAGGGGADGTYTYGLGGGTGFTDNIPAARQFVVGAPSGNDTLQVPTQRFASGSGGPDYALVKQYVSEAVNSSLGDDARGTVYAFIIDKNGFPIAVIWAKDYGDDYVGGYPNQADEKNWTLDKAKNSGS